MNLRVGVAGLAFLALSGWSCLVHAQVPPGTPTGTTREEILREPVTPVPPTTAQRVTVEGEVERAPCPLAAPEFSNVKITLRGVDFGEMKGISSDLLRESWADSEGQEISIAAVCEIRDRAATILRRNGYLAAVQVPPQKIDNGVIRFDVLLAKLVDFQVRGNAGRSERVIAGYLQAIRELPVFNILQAERYLLLARDIPGYDVRMTLRPADGAPGEVIGEVQVVHTPVEMEINGQNFGSTDVGRIGGLAQLRLNGLLGLGDRTSLGLYSTAQTREQTVLLFGQEFKIGSEGLAISGDFTYAWTRPSLGPTLDLRSKTLSASIEARYPVVRRQTRNAVISGGLDYVNQRSRFAGLPLNEDKLRVVYARINGDILDPASLASLEGYSAAEPRWRIGGSLELRQGLSILSASKGCGANNARCALPGVVPPTRIEGDPTGFVARITGYAEFRPTRLLAVSIAPRLQYSPDALLSYEEFSAGNFTVGRGYNPGTLTGDSGVGYATEIRYGSLIAQSAKSTAVQGYGFMDVAWVWNEDRLNPLPDPQKLVSVGAGVRLAYGDRIRLDAAAAVPLRRTGLQTKRGDIRFLMNLTVRLLPWSRR